jgi:hypothetical protein
MNSVIREQPSLRKGLIDDSLQEQQSNATVPVSIQALQLFEPDQNIIYAIDDAAHLAGMTRHMILVCCKHGLVAALVDPAYGGYLFDYEAIQTLRRIEVLREVCGFNVVGLKLTLDLTREVERLREMMRAAVCETGVDESPAS